MKPKIIFLEALIPQFVPFKGLGESLSILNEVKEPIFMT
jgi:hypothetical protein